MPLRARAVEHLTEDGISGPALVPQEVRYRSLVAVIQIIASSLAA
jgi:hypothetical protein